MKKYLKLSLMLIAGLLVSCSGDGRFGREGSGGWMPMMNYGTGYVGGMYMWIILLIVVGVGAYFFVQYQKTKSQGQRPTQQMTTQNESHLDILKKRYAKGEVSKEEYEKMKKNLEG